MKEISFNSFMYTLDLLPTGVLVLDKDGKILFWNKGATLLTEIPAEIVKERYFDEAIEISDVFSKKLFFECILDLLKEPETSTALEAWIEKPSGTLLHVRLFAAKLCENNDEDYGIAIVFHDVTIEEILGEALEESYSKLTVDYLTRLNNKESLNVYLADHLENLRRGKYNFAAVFFDIDHFKKINDQFGHLAGDRVLESLGRFLKEHIRKGEKAFRFGGDEFVIVLIYDSESEISNFIGRIKEGLKKANLPLNITLSSGYAFAKKEDTPESLLARADLLMYEEKNLLHHNSGESSVD